MGKLGGMVVILAVLVGCRLATTPTSAGEAVPRNAIGINLSVGASKDWGGDRLFADAMKQARRWYKVGATDQPAAVDSHFWPTEDAGLCIMDLADNEGTYRGSFTGTATVSPGNWGLGSTGGKIQNVVYDQAKNKTTFEVVLPLHTGAFTLKFTDSFRDAAKTLGGIVDLKLMRPLTKGSNQSYPESAVFTDPIVALVKKFQAIRFMDYTVTNGNQQTTWDQRALPTDASFGSDFRNLAGTAVGGAYEYAVALCNLAGCDLWINVPLKADDAYVTALATLIRDGANGFSGLDPRLNVYVEYSNELWNTAAAFTQGGENRTLAIAEEAAGKTPSLRAKDTSENTWYWAWRRVGRRIVEISDLFRTVWGDDAMPAPGKASPRIRPVLMGQEGNPGGFEVPVLTYIDRNFSHPVNYYLYAAGGSAYYNPSATAFDVASLLSSETMSWSTWLDKFVVPEVAVARAFGLKRIAYEGGPSLDKGAANDAVRKLAWGDARMEQNLVDHVDRAWSAADGDLLMFYATTGDYQWAFTTDISSFDTPKLRAINTLNALSKAAPTVGQTPPFSVQGGGYASSFQYSNYSYGNSAERVLKGDAYGVYTFRVTQEGTYTAAVTLDSTAGRWELWIDGAAQASGTTASAAAPVAVSASGLLPGLHALVVKTFDPNSSGTTVSVKSISFAKP